MRRHNKISFRPHLTTWYHQGKSSKYKPVLGYVAPGYSVAPKERCTLVGIQFEEKWPSEEIMEHLVKRLDIQVKYKSFYGEVFSMGLHD